MTTNRYGAARVWIAGAALLVTWLWTGGPAAPAQGRGRSGSAPGPTEEWSQVLGRPTDRSVTLSVLSARACTAVVEIGTAPGQYTRKTAPVSAAAGQPVEIEIGDLQPDTGYTYRVQARGEGDTEYRASEECTFHTRRAPGSAFTFALQGDSHPEREGRMFDGTLYARTMANVAADRPDFYVTLGDDFSIEHLIDRAMLSQENADRVYAYQRGYLGIIGRSAPLFLVNGNHEQAARCWLDGTATNPGVLAARARTRYFPLPAPDAFYTGDAEQTPPIGLLRDYYAWTWGDALFIVIDPYWHSTIAVDGDGRRGGDASGGGGAAAGGDAANGRRGGGGGGAAAGADAAGGRRGGGGAAAGGDAAGGRRGGGGKGGRDLWLATLGEAQYRWFAATLAQSKAKYRFVFAHHVLGTGRGGIEEAGLYEWGGRDRRGDNLFAEKRPGWEAPIHDLMVKYGVTVFFQGHDHIFAHQVLDGVVYQSTPNPADPTYEAFNRAAYRSGDVFPNSGHLRVRVAAEGVRVDYVRAYLPADETGAQKNGQVAFSYTVTPRAR